MPRNPLTRAPRNSNKRNFEGHGYDFDIWLVIFPDQGVEVHVGINHIDHDTFVDLTVSPTLIGVSKGSKKENKATSAEISISSAAIRFRNIPQVSKNVGFSSCGHCQIQDINEAEFDARGFRLQN